MGQRILVVDDDKEIVRILRAYLEKVGYAVLIAYDGETALHIMSTATALTVIVLAFAFFFGVVTWSARKLLHAAKRTVE